jgi:hypothetical protein
MLVLPGLISVVSKFKQYLFTVNAGSNTLSMFFIDKADPSAPKLLNTAPTLGEFPSSVAYSPKLKTGTFLSCCTTLS